MKSWNLNHQRNFKVKVWENPDGMDPLDTKNGWKPMRLYGWEITDAGKDEAEGGYWFTFSTDDGRRFGFSLTDDQLLDIYTHKRD